MYQHWFEVCELRLDCGSDPAVDGDDELLRFVAHVLVAVFQKLRRQLHQRLRWQNLRSESAASKSKTTSRDVLTCI